MRNIHSGTLRLSYRRNDTRQTRTFRTRTNGCAQCAPRGAGDGTCGPIVSRARSNSVSGLGRRCSTVTVGARVGTWDGRVDVITCRARASVTCAGRGHVRALTRGVRSGAAATRGRVSGAAFFVHAHQIGGNIAGVAVASKASAGSSYIDARAVAAAGIARTAVDVGAGTLVVKVTHGTFTRIAIQRSSIINTHTLSTSQYNHQCPRRCLPSLERSPFGN